ncbi:fimbrillin family protein [Elizabethkingia ursingii]|uniref:fimbrillin family protein n=1 Tax=Elizabethkingia ursingii TaxID=1756150 RepID=UPI0007507DB7|nr:fimbrillin family protein [Elizabethkingia ursingii]KUY29497.1 hypothetical protein ATB96_02125 [Elizabethkingia ursingii]
MKILHNKYRAIITSLILVITSLIFILSFLSLSSCRSAEHDNIVTGRGITAVKINLLGSDYKGSSRDISQVQKHTTLVNPSTAIVAELNSTMPTRSISGDQIGSGVQFRVIVYRFNDNTYQTHMDYTVGQPAQPIMLDGGEKYNIIIYSYASSTTLPEISMEEKMNLTNAQIRYDDDNRDLMYQKIAEYIPDGNNPNNKVDIKLRHKLSQITTVINSYIGDISSISNAVLGPHYNDGSLSLSTGIIKGRTTSSNQNLTFPGVLPSTTTATADPVLINAGTDTGEYVPGAFSATLNIAGATKTINLPNTFKITPENKSTLTINLRKCGAYLGPNNTQWKEFMCQNLGATEGIDPFSPVAGNHGAKYQWGYKPINVNSSDDRYYTQSDDQSNSGSIPGWNRTGKSDDSWSDTHKTASDPCPSGYRVPNKDQWQAVINNNFPEKVGSWDDDSTNYSSVLYFRNPSNVRTLMLPAAGSRAFQYGELGRRGYRGSYWSSSWNSSWGAVTGFFAEFIGNAGFIDEYNRTFGFPVRCIAE